MIVIIIFNSWRAAAFSICLLRRAEGTCLRPPGCGAAGRGGRPWQQLAVPLLPTIAALLTNTLLITLWTLTTSRRS